MALRMNHRKFSYSANLHFVHRVYLLGLYDFKNKYELLYLNSINKLVSTVQTHFIWSGKLVSKYFYSDGTTAHIWALSSSILRFLKHTKLDTQTSDQLVAEASTYTGQHNILTQEKNINARSVIRTRDPSNDAATDLGFRPCGHWDRKFLSTVKWFVNAYLKDQKTESVPGRTHFYILFQ
jgi:hypothetical protein